MGLIPEPASLIRRGIASAFRGLRTGDQRALLQGAVIAAWGLWRRSMAPQRTLIRRETLKPGQALVIREHRGDAERIRVVRGQHGER